MGRLGCYTHNRPNMTCQMGSIGFGCLRHHLYLGHLRERPQYAEITSSQRWAAETYVDL